MLAALSMRFGAVETLREDAGLMVARAHECGQPVLLCHRNGLSGASVAANRVVANRLQTLGAFGAPIAWHQGPTGVTWVVDADDGIFLDDWLVARPVVPLPQALCILLDLAQALDTLHRHGIVHLRLRPACVRIAIGRGVCGTAAATRQTQRVADVDAFPGHIPCDSASRSELVVPLYQGERLVGVFDLDSPELDRFDADDQAGLEAIARAFLDTLPA